MNKVLKVSLAMFIVISIFTLGGIYIVKKMNKQVAALIENSIVGVAIVNDYETHTPSRGRTYYIIEYKYKYNYKYYKGIIDTQDENIIHKIENLQTKYPVVISKKNPEIHCVYFYKKINQKFNLSDKLSIKIKEEDLRHSPGLAGGKASKIERIIVRHQNKPIDRVDLIFKIILFLSIGVLIILFGWLFYGIDLKKGNIEISGSPKKDISPAILNSILNSEFVKKNIFCFSLFSLAEKGYLSIDIDHNTIILNKDIFLSINNINSLEINKNEVISTINLSSEEKILLEFLNKFQTSTIHLPNKYNDQWKNLFIDLEFSCFSENKNKKYFVENEFFMMIGGVSFLISIFFFYTLYSFGFKLIFFVLCLFIFYIIMKNLLKNHSTTGRIILDKIEGYIAYLKSEDKIFIQTQSGKQHIQNFVYAMAINQSENWFKKIKESDIISTNELHWLITKNKIDKNSIPNYIEKIGNIIESIIKK